MKEFVVQDKVVQIDDEDYEEIRRYLWRIDKSRYTFYVKMRNKGSVPISDFIMGTPPSGFLWDHKDGDGLNNQKLNLRLATFSQNVASRRMQCNNTLGYVGVTQNGGGFMARIKVKGVNIHLGTHKSLELAARAYDTAAIKHFGEFARLNFPSDKNAKIRNI